HLGQRRAGLDRARTCKGSARALFSLPPSRGKGRGWGGARQLTSIFFFLPAAKLKGEHLMKMSFWSQCQGLVRRLQLSHTAPRARLRRRPSWVAEALEDRALLSSTPAMVADIVPGSGSSNVQNLTAIGSTIYFTANDGTHGVELWKSDATA